MQGHPTEDKPRCARCGDVIGAYEPMIVVIDGEPRKVPRGPERDSDQQLGERYHHDCYP
ncbi:MAG: hypothetical protein ACRDJ3_05185 [Solirubrobacteraceae bacterium]